jgi:hypothetical protein
MQFLGSFGIGLRESANLISAGFEVLLFMSPDEAFAFLTAILTIRDV